MTNHTKSIDLEHLKNTQHSLAIQQQKYKRLRKDYTWSKYNWSKYTWSKNTQLQSYSTLTWKSKAWCESWKLEIKFVKLNFSKLFLTLHKHIPTFHQTPWIWILQNSWSLLINNLPLFDEDKSLVACVDLVWIWSNTYKTETMQTRASLIAGYDDTSTSSLQNLKSRKTSHKINQTAAPNQPAYAEIF